jgi:hypothetical protein
MSSLVYFGPGGFLNGGQTMRLYLASLYLPVLLKYHKRFGRKLNVLRSFGQLDGQDFDIAKKHRDKVAGLILDSGTWTLNNAEHPSPRITYPNFKRFVSSVGQEYYDFYFNFDKDFNDDGFGHNLANQVDMEKQGLTPVPVVHDIFGAEIDHYIERSYKRVALGSKQIKTPETLEYVMNRFKGTGIKIHLFGKSGFHFLCDFPIDSSDTADWVLEGKYGYILYWNPEKKGLNKTDKIYMEEYIQDPKDQGVTFSNYEFREDLEKHLQEALGVTRDDVLGLDGAHVKMLINTYYYAQLEGVINEIHRERGFKTE